MCTEQFASLSDEAFKPDGGRDLHLLAVRSNFELPFVPCDPSLTDKPLIHLISRRYFYLALGHSHANCDVDVFFLAYEHNTTFTTARLAHHFLSCIKQQVTMRSCLVYS